MLSEELRSWCVDWRTKVTKKDWEFLV